MSSIKSDKEIEELLNHKNNTLKKVGVEVKIIGSGNHGNGGAPKGSKYDRNKDNHSTIAVTAELIGDKGAAQLLGTSQAQVSKYRRGLNSSNDPDPELQELTERKLGRISTKVVDKVDQLLELFADDRMNDLQPKEMPGAIEKLVNTYDKINRRHEKGDGSNRPQVILYAPKQINISEYITKEV